MICDEERVNRPMLCLADASLLCGDLGRRFRLGGERMCLEWSC